MELTPLAIRFNNLTNYNITQNDFYNGYNKKINQLNQEDWGFFSLNGLIKNEHNLLDSKHSRLKSDYLSQSFPSVLAPKDTTYWNGKFCFYSDGINNNYVFSVFEPFLEENFNMGTWINQDTNPSIDPNFSMIVDPNSNKLYTFFSLQCNKKTCTKSNLKEISINFGGFICPNSEETQLASDEKNTLWKNGHCFYKPTNFTSDSSFACHYPNSNYFSSIALNNPSNKQLVNDNIDDNFFCYPFFSQFTQSEDCIKEKLDLFFINSDKFFIPKQFPKPTFIWDGDYSRCFYYDSVEINDNKVFYYGNLPYMYSYHSINSSCNINSCKNNKIVPTSNGFSCSLTSSLSNWNLNKVIDKVMVKQSTDPSAPTEFAPAGSTYWNGNTCFYSNGDEGNPTNYYISTIHKSYYKLFLEPYFTINSALDPNSDKVYTWYSYKCNKKTCTTDNLNGNSINDNGFRCPNPDQTQLASNEKNTLWKNGSCFHKPINFTIDSVFSCFYPNYLSYDIILLSNDSDKQSKNNNVDDNFFCYPFVSANIKPEDCIKEKLDLFVINSSYFLIPKQLQSNFLWDQNHNRCFYYDGIEVNDNKIFFYGNLPYMYSYHSNDLSCNINNCKNGFTANPNTNQFKCIKTNYGITTYYPVDFAMIKEFFNTIGSLFKIPSMDTLHWAIYYPLMVILYPLSPWITVFWEPWVNLANSIQLFMAIRNL
jgi:hypothetical protein